MDAEPMCLVRLRWSVQALAQEAEVQLGLFPPFVCVADELALELDEHRRAVIAAMGDASPANAAPMLELDAYLDRMSGPGHLEMWTDEALREAPEWREVRRLATAVLDAMGWPHDAPPGDRGDVYVGPAN